VSGRPSKLTLLRPKWLLLHAFALAACAAMIWLGQWQWRVAIRHHGDLRNYAYALQWWAFVGFTVLMWGRIVTDHLRSGTADQTPAGADGPVAEPAVGPGAAPGGRYRGYTLAASSPDAETDPERRRFNAYLAQLDAADREASE
jgi:hypothetical protein